MGDPLSFQERLALIRRVNGLPPTQFNELVFALAPPLGTIPGGSAAQGDRSAALLQWLESSSGPGLAIALEILEGEQPKPKQPSFSNYQQPLGNGSILEMVFIPGGRFIMGAVPDEPYSLESERPHHYVTLPSFFVGKYPVTQAQWRAVARLPIVNRELKADPSSFKGDNRPVEQVSWHDTVEFCQRLSAYSERDYRLPSEAEWEYACRAGTTTAYYFGDSITEDQVNYNSHYEQTTDVGRFPANTFGLYDMHGNVFEWCQDVWHENYQGAPTDGTAWLKGGKEGRRIVRGGSWISDPRSCRSTFRLRDEPEGYDTAVGFRVACTASRKQATAPRTL